MYSFTQYFVKPIFAGIAPLEGKLNKGTVQSGFPSPAEDPAVHRTDLTGLLVKPIQASHFRKASNTQ